MNIEVTTSHTSDWSALATVRKLGPLAPLVLKPSVLTAARNEAERTDEPINKTSFEFQPIREPGLAMLLYVRKCDNDFVDDAFALPVKWQESASGHARILPDELKEVADLAVKILFSGDGPANPQGWFLQTVCAEQFYANFWQILHPQTSDVALPSDSAFATLFTTLYLAPWDAPPATVWASAAFGQVNGLDGVESAEVKAKLVARIGQTIGQPPQFFLHSDNCEEAKTAAPQIDIKEFGQTSAGYSRTPREQVFKALAPLLTALDAPPDASAVVETRIAYWKRCIDRNDREQADRYDREKLRDDTIKNLHHGFELPTAHLHLIGFVEDHKQDQFDLLAQAFDIPPGRQLEVSCSGSAAVALDGRRLCLPDEMKENIRQMTEGISNAIRQRWPGAGAGSFLFDLTAGTKLMTVAMIEAMPSGAFAGYLSHKLYPPGRPGGRPEPVATSLRIWCKGPDGKLEIVGPPELKP